jgi:hypothetical protein
MFSGVYELRAALRQANAVQRQNYIERLKFLLDSVGERSSLLDVSAEYELEQKLHEVVHRQTPSGPAKAGPIGRMLSSLRIPTSISFENSVHSEIKLAAAIKESQLLATMRIQAVMALYALRRLLNRQIFVCFIGSHQIGKSTLMRKMRGCEGAATRTEALEMTKFATSTHACEVYTVDYPGVTDRDSKYCRSFRQLGCMSSLTVILMPCKTPGQTELDVLVESAKTAYLKGSANPALVVLATHADKEKPTVASEESVRKAAEKWAEMFTKELEKVKTDDEQALGLVIRPDQIKLVSVQNAEGGHESHSEEYAGQWNEHSFSA